MTPRPLKITAHEMAWLVALGQFLGGLTAFAFVAVFVDSWRVLALCLVAWMGVARLVLRMGDRLIERTYLEPETATEEGSR